MPMEYTPLSPEELPPGVARAVGPNAPAPAKMMAAKGLAPMGPKDLVTALYQLSVDSDEKIAAAAQQTAGKLPDNILDAALGEALEPRVIDFFALQLVERASLIEKILLNNATGDETFVSLASKLAERELEIMAGNQARILGCPSIIEEMYFNRAARMSTVEKLMEMAVRNGITLARIPAFDAFAKDILGSGEQQEPEPVQEPQMDALFTAVLSEGWDQGGVGDLEYDEAEAKEKTKNISEMTVNEKIRLATIGNVFHRGELIRDSNRLVSMAVICSPGVNEQEAARYAADRGLREDVIRFIANKKEWMKNYKIKVALANNPKTPLASAMKMLRMLRQSDVRAIARSKNVPAAVAKVAKQMSRR